MRNLIEMTSAGNNINKVNILVEEQDLYSEFFDDFENIKLVGRIIQLYEDNKSYFLDVVNCLHIINTQKSSIQNNKSLNKSLCAFLGNMQPYLNGLQNCCDKEFFKLVTNIIHKNHKGYQICYEIRNILQHKGLPYSISQGKNKTLELNIDVEELLSNYNISNDKKYKLFGNQKIIDLLPQLSEFYLAECEIYERIFLHTLDVDKYPRFFNYLLKYKKPNNLLYLALNMETTKKETPMEMKWSLVGLEMDKYYQIIMAYNNSQIRGSDINKKVDYRNIFSFLQKE